MPKIGLPRDDRVDVHARRGLPMILKSFGSFSLTVAQSGTGMAGDLRGQFAVPERAVRRRVHHTARSGGQFGFRHIPRLRRGRDEHLPRPRAPTWRIGIQLFGVPVLPPVDLAAVLRRIEIGLLDLDVLPIDVEFFGDQHRQHVLDALPDFGVLGHDRDRAVGGDLMKSSGGRRRRGPRPPRP